MINEAAIKVAAFFMFMRKRSVIMFEFG